MDKSKKRLIYSAAAYMLSALSAILAMLDVSAVICGIFFWGGLLAGIGLYITAVRALPESAQTARGGAFRFFTNKIAGITDVILVISMGLTVVFSIRYESSQTVAAFILFLLILSVYGHFVFNGKVFNYLTKDKERE